MKTFKQISITIIIMVIVISSTSFKQKSCVICASLTSGVGSCTRVFEKTECNNGNTGTSYYKYNSWDGNPLNCNSSTACTTPVTLYPEF